MAGLRAAALPYVQSLALWPKALPFDQSGIRELWVATAGEQPDLWLAMGEPETLHSGLIPEGTLSQVELYRAGATLAAFPEPGLMLAGSDTLVRQALNTSKQPADPILREHIRLARPDADAWFASVIPASEVGRRMPDRNLNGAMQGDLLKTLRGYHGSARLGSQIEVQAEGVAQNAKDASALADVGKFLIEVGKAYHPNAFPGRLFRKMTDVTFQTRQSTVSMAFRVPRDEFRWLLGEAAELAADFHPYFGANLP